jgi:hypothetical protein
MLRVNDNSPHRARYGGGAESFEARFDRMHRILGRFPHTKLADKTKTCQETQILA